jgi:hypothetical protein
LDVLRPIFREFAREYPNSQVGFWKMWREEFRKTINVIYYMKLCRTAIIFIWLLHRTQNVTNSVYPIFFFQFRSWPTVKRKIVNDFLPQCYWSKE